MGRQALRHQVGVVLLANWVEVEMLVWRPSFPSLASLGSVSPIVEETPDPRVLQRIFTGCLHLWFCCDLIGGGSCF